MTVYKGIIGSRKFADKVRDILIAEGYVEMSSNVSTDGRVFLSKGTNGTSDFYVRLMEFSSYLSVGVYEKYIPGSGTGISGTFTNGVMHDCIKWNMNNVSDRAELNYIINVSKDRMIVFVEGMKLEPNAINSLTYIGLPKRYSPADVNGDFASVATTGYSNATQTRSNWIPLRSRNLIPQSSYPLDYYIPNRSFGWGGKMFFSSIYIGTASEGYRGELDGLMVMELVDQNTEIRHLDTFSKNGKQYVVIVPSTSSGNYYHLNYSYTYLMEV